MNLVILFLDTTFFTVKSLSCILAVYIALDVKFLVNLENQWNLNAELLYDSWIRLENFP